MPNEALKIPEWTEPSASSFTSRTGLRVLLGDPIATPLLISIYLLGAHQARRKDSQLDRWIVRPGLKAAYWLVNREGGKGLIVTFWDSAEAMHASEQSRLKRQAATSGVTGARVTTDRYEVIDSLTM